MQAIKEQYQLNTIGFSMPFKFKKHQGSLKIIVEQSSDKYLIAMDPSNAEVYIHFINHNTLNLTDFVD